MVLQSERVIIESPMSFTGSAKRIWRMTNVDNGGLRLLAILVAVSLIVVAWTFVAAWYLVFGIFLIPYRLLRRGARKRKRDELRHREVLQSQTNNKTA